MVPIELYLYLCLLYPLLCPCNMISWGMKWCPLYSSPIPWAAPMGPYPNSPVCHGTWVYWGMSAVSMASATGSMDPWNDVWIHHAWLHGFISAIFIGEICMSAWYPCTHAHMQITPICTMLYEQKIATLPMCNLTILHFAVTYFRCAQAISAP